MPNQDWDADYEELEREPFADDWSLADDAGGADEEPAAASAPVVPLEARDGTMRPQEARDGTMRRELAPRSRKKPQEARAAPGDEDATQTPTTRPEPRRSAPASLAPVAPTTRPEPRRSAPASLAPVAPTTRPEPRRAAPASRALPNPPPPQSKTPAANTAESKTPRRRLPSLKRPHFPRPRLPRPSLPRFSLFRRRAAPEEKAATPAAAKNTPSANGRARSSRAAPPAPSLFFRALAAIPGLGQRERPTGRRRRRSERRPRIIAEGLSLDDKLDILGVLLVIASVVLSLSALSANPGALIAPINDFLGRLLGQGALAAPITMFALGVWLIMRYFGEEAPLMDLRRGAGALLLYCSLLVILQFFETFTSAYANVDLAEPSTLRIPLELTWTLKRAGGWLGAQLYLLLLTTVGELGALFVVVGAILLGTRFASEVSTYEMARWSMGAWRRGAERRAARRAERQTARAEREREAAERAAQIEAIEAAQAARRERESALLELYPPPTNNAPVAPKPLPVLAAPPITTDHSLPASTSTPAPMPPPTRSAAASTSPWQLPDYADMLSGGGEQRLEREVLRERAQIIEDTLRSFGAPGRVVAINSGPVITQFGVEPLHWEQRSGKQSRVKVGAIAQLEKDIQLALGARTIRVEAPVPGKGYVGIEVPNKTAALVSLRDVMATDAFRRLHSPLAIALGQRVDGSPVAADLIRMPHLLIAGTTGSGKSVCVNAIINSILLHNAPQQVRFLMIDPKRVELANYNGLPHLISPVVVEMERTVAMLKWVTAEMDQRYQRFSQSGARNIIEYNEQLPAGSDPLPYIVVVIDELADLMMTAPDITERLITRIAALARATGIHLVIATQRPSVDVVTGLIKANFPARIAFAVAGGVDSRVILDQPGAERLLGRGDMLFQSGEAPAPLRMQGVFVSDSEIENILSFWRAQGRTPLAPSTNPLPIRTAQKAIWSEAENGEEQTYAQAVALVRRLKKASVSLLQRRMRIGYNRAARLIDRMEAEGIVGPPTEGSKPRAVLALPEEMA